MKRTDLHEYQNYCVEFLKTHREAMLWKWVSARARSRSPPFWT